MTEIWLDSFPGIVPRRDYTVHLSAGEKNGLVVSLEGKDTSVSIEFGAVHAYQMLDEGVLLRGVDSEQFTVIREQNFSSTIYEIENGNFGRFIESQMGSNLYSFLNCRQYNIVTLNYVISVVTLCPPEITVAQI